MRRAERFRRAIERLEAEEAQGHEFGLNDDEFYSLRFTLAFREREWFDGTMAPHIRIVALGFALAICEHAAKTLQQRGDCHPKG